MPLIRDKWPYVAPVKVGKNEMRKQKVIVDGIRFCKRMANVPALPGTDRVNLGSNLMTKIVNKYLFYDIIKCFEYGLKEGDKEIVDESSMAISMINSHGKMALRYLKYYQT